LLCNVSTTSHPPFFLHCDGDHRYLHSFPTRRSSDLVNPSRTRLPGRKKKRRFARRRVSKGETAETLARPSLRSEGRRQSAFRALDRKSTRLNSSHVSISYAVFCLKKKKKHN